MITKVFKLLYYVSRIFLVLKLIFGDPTVELRPLGEAGTYFINAFVVGVAGLDWAFGVNEFRLFNMFCGDDYEKSYFRL